MLPLTTALVQECTEERTQDFTMALWEFVRWDDNKNKIRESAFTPGRGHLGSLSLGIGNPNVIDISNNNDDIESDSEYREMVGVGVGVTDGSNTSDYRYYVWPDFILDLLNRPTAWAAWRKKTERDLMGGNNYYNGRLSEGGVVTVDLAGITVQEEVKKIHRPVTRRMAYFTALCTDREAELDEKR